LTLKEFEINTANTHRYTGNIFGFKNGQKYKNNYNEAILAYNKLRLKKNCNKYSVTEISQDSICLYVYCSWLHLTFLYIKHEDGPK